MKIKRLLIPIVSSTLMLLGSVSTTAQTVCNGSINTIPMYGYGSVNKCPALLKLDKRFLAECDQKFLNRRAASTYFTGKGWEYLKAGDQATAIKRYNQAWLLDSTNATVYWGFGAITGQRKQYDASLCYFQMSQKRDSTNKRILIDIAQTFLIRYDEKKQSVDLENANTNLRRFLAQSPDTSVNALAYIRLATIYFHKRDYSNAWKYVDLTNGLNPALMQEWHLLPELKKIAPRG